MTQNGPYVARVSARLDGEPIVDWGVYRGAVLFAAFAAMNSPLNVTAFALGVNYAFFEVRLVVVSSPKPDTAYH